MNEACDGGWMLDAYEFTRDNGIIHWDDYVRSYNGRANRCKEPSAFTEKFFNAGGFEEDMVSNERMKELISHGPVGVAIYSNYDCLSSYRSGIVTDRACDCSNPDDMDVNHAVTVVGYGKSNQRGCSEYWLIKNSWGPLWGLDGHFKLCADRHGKTEEFGTCQINSYVMWPTLDYYGIEYIQ